MSPREQAESCSCFCFDYERSTSCCDRHRARNSGGICRGVKRLRYVMIVVTRDIRASTNAAAEDDGRTCYSCGNMQ